jgi:hypothetical protein
MIVVFHERILMVSRRRWGFVVTVRKRVFFFENCHVLVAERLDQLQQQPPQFVIAGYRIEPGHRVPSINVTGPSIQCVWVRVN